jgi:hypothetical protein
MKQYGLYKKQSIVAVKYGWSWVGMIFGSLWALIKCQWGLVILILATESCAFYGIRHFENMGNYDVAERFNYLFMVISIFWTFYLGKTGNNHIRNKLLTNGYEYLGEVIAPSKDAAILQSSKTFVPVGITPMPAQ